ncbi:MAG: heterodisulfide reductase-related iron-sulfur binding cluster, partial [Methylocystaceae bacterium]
MNNETLMQVGNCAICPNMCRFDCPVNNAMRREGVSPAGKMRLAYMLEQGTLDPAPAAVANLYQCLGCRGCETWCAFPDLSVADLLAEARIKYAGAGLAPSVIYEVKKQLDEYQTLFTPEEMQSSPAEVDPGAEVLLFAGCAYRKYRPQAIEAALSLLQAAGLRVTMLEDETCCGFPAGCLGIMDTTGRLARQAISKIKASGVKQVVTLCPECFSAFSKRYPAAGLELGVTVQQFAPFVLSLLQANKLVGLKRFAASVVWHDPCVLGRGLGLYEEPRHLLQAVPGLQLKEARYNREQAHCCGAGQLYDQLEPSAATRITQIRNEELEATAADLIVTCCPFCEHQLGQTAKLPVVDLAEVLWASWQEGRDKDYILEQKLQIALHQEPLLAGKNIRVQVEQGLVKLEGQVDTWAQVVKSGLKAGEFPGV